MELSSLCCKIISRNIELLYAHICRDKIEILFFFCLSKVL